MAPMEQPVEVKSAGNRLCKLALALFSRTEICRLGLGDLILTPETLQVSYCIKLDLPETKDRHYPQSPLCFVLQSLSCPGYSNLNSWTRS